ncbi:MAG: hypothetical protein FWC79_06075 [Oscillospiraceae bacterium]|nr:hypothetical protein [Oscillospiraceae bacterium]
MNSEQKTLSSHEKNVREIKANFWVWLGAFIVCVILIGIPFVIPGAENWFLPMRNSSST